MINFWRGCHDLGQRFLASVTGSLPCSVGCQPDRMAGDDSFTFAPHKPSPLPSQVTEFVAWVWELDRRFAWLSRPARRDVRPSHGCGRLPNSPTPQRPQSTTHTRLTSLQNPLLNKATVTDTTARDQTDAKPVPLNVAASRQRKKVPFQIGYSNADWLRRSKAEAGACSGLAFPQARAHGMGRP